ncbi:hypothetical protein R50073_46920 [Maricurvus nonylphenolicus]|uniref:hypothetical protein n=1 Tax=Maricurvus nonylphenolicus TaxID=1008307 RepID=UPI0036F3336B
MKHHLLFIFILFLFASPNLLASKASVKQCQSWQKKIDQYTKLRQQGGSASKMNKWQKARKKYKQRWYEGGCQKGKTMGSL